MGDGCHGLESTTYLFRAIVHGILAPVFPQDFRSSGQACWLSNVIGQPSELKGPTCCFVQSCGGKVARRRRWDMQFVRQNCVNDGGEQSRSLQALHCQKVP